MMEDTGAELNFKRKKKGSELPSRCVSVHAIYTNSRTYYISEAGKT